MLHIILTPDEELNGLINGMPYYVIMYRRVTNC